MYQNFPYNVQRWDTIRYMMLYVYGGIYTDLDTECFQPISPILENVTIGFGEEPPIHTKPIRIGNAFLVSEKENSAWQTILNEILRNMVEKESAIETVMHSTGPNMINRLFDRLKKENGAYGFPYSQVTPVSKYDMYRYIFQGEKEVFLEKIKHAYCAHYFFGSWDTELTFY